jgi:hypothetical protein
MQNDDICKAWQGQGGGAAPFSLEQLRGKAGTFQTQIERRNVAEYVGMALGLPVFLYSMCQSPFVWMRVGDGLMVAGVTYMGYQLHRRGSSSAMPADMAWKNCLEFHRGELERQRDALVSIWKWYLGPVVPGLLTLIGGAAVSAFQRSTAAGMKALGIAAMVAMALWFVGWLNRRAAGKIQKQIDELVG